MKKFILGSNISMGLMMVFLSSYVAERGATEIEVTDLRSAKGQVVVQVFKSEAAYEDQIPLKKFTFDKKGLKNGTLKLSLALEPGVYGLTMFDDENMNGKIDKSFIGIPKEGFGFSNFFMEKMQKPKFQDIKIDVERVQKIVLKVKYM